MTAYEAIKSLNEAQISALLSGGIIRADNLERNIRLFEFYEDKCKAMPIMEAITETALRFHLSEEMVRKIIRKMRQ